MASVLDKLAQLTYYTTPYGIRYAELKSPDQKTGSYEVDESGNLSGVRYFYVPDYPTSSGFLEYMLGTKFNRFSPQPLNGPRPMFPGAPIFAKRGSVEGVGRATGPYESPDYSQGCIATINYGTLEYNPEEDQEGQPDPENPESQSYLSLDTDLATEQYTWNKAKLLWRTGNQPLQKFDQAPVTRLGTGTATFTRHLVTEFKLSDYLIDLGRVNSVAIWEFPIDTLLFTGASYSASLGTLNNVSMSVVCNFLYREKKWGYFFNSATGMWDEVFIDDGAPTGAPLYDTSDFKKTLPELYGARKAS